MASKDAIGRMRLDALNRIADATDKLAHSLGVERLDLAAVTNRDPAYQHAARLRRLAEWCESLVVTLIDSGIDLSSAQTISAKLETIEGVLDQGLNALRIQDLKGILEDLGVEFSCNTKQEFVNEVTRALTGKEVESLLAEPEAPETESAGEAD